MKHIFCSLIIFVGFSGFVAPVLAEQEALSCFQDEPMADNGYNLTFTPGQKSVSVVLSTLIGAQEIANLNCSKPPPPKETYPDQIIEVLTCGPTMADAGYYLSVSSGGFAGLTTAVLYEQNIAGSTVTARFHCKYGR